MMKSLQHPFIDLQNNIYISFIFRAHALYAYVNNKAQKLMSGIGYNLLYKRPLITKK